MNPLHKLHEQAEAEFQPYGEVEIVSTFGEPQAEYAAIRKGCALIDLPQRGILEATGADRIDFLNRFLTNQLKAADGKTPMGAGTGVYAFLLNNKGRIVADVNVLERGDRTLLETDARNIAGLQAVLEKHVFSEKVKFSTLVESGHQVGLMGPGAAEVLRHLFGEMPVLNVLGSMSVKMEGGSVKVFPGSTDGRPSPQPSPGVQLDAARHGPGEGEMGERAGRGPGEEEGFQKPRIIAGSDGGDAVIWRDDPCGVLGYFVLVPSEVAARFWMNILSAFPAGEPGKRAVRPVGWAVFNTARIEAGRPLFGIDFDDSVLPAETAQLERAVSFTKGCYLGQEIVARMHARGQVARKIVGIRMQEDALPIAGAPILDEAQNQIGGITSSTVSPILSGASICLGLIKSTFSAIGTEIKVAAEGAIRKGVVAKVPFVKTVGLGAGERLRTEEA